MSVDTSDAETTKSETTKSETTKSDEVLADIRGVRDALTIGRVFGDPYEVDGLTVIPVARVTGGAGGGAGESSEGDTPGAGFGTAFGMEARGIGVYQVRDGEVTWKPAVDVTRIAKGGQVLTGIALVCLTLILLGRARRT
jgi:uncharacterized spore protein YtfJ